MANPIGTVTIDTTEQAQEFLDGLCNLVETLESQLTDINAKLRVAREDDAFHVIAYRVALRGVCEALSVFTDPDHGPVTKKDWEFVLRNEKHAWEMLERRRDECAGN